MEKILVYGHSNPDTDTICSSIALTDLQRKLGKEVEAVRLGELNKETEAQIVEKMIGKRVCVLIEGKPKTHKGESYAFGFTENYVKVLLDKKFVEKKGELVCVYIKSAADGFLFAE